MAAVAEVDIYNMALSFIGVTTTVAATTEKSPEARTCSIWYERVRNAIQRAAPWSCLKATARLALKATRDPTLDWASTDPTPGYLYAYNLPSDMQIPRYMVDFSMFELSTMQDGSRCLMNSSANALLIYNRRVTDPSAWDEGLITAISAGLAAKIVKPITGKTSDLSGYLQLASQELIGARLLDAPYSGVPMQQPLPEWLQERGSSYGAPFTPYIYPLANPVVGGTLVT